MLTTPVSKKTSQTGRQARPHISVGTPTNSTGGYIAVSEVQLILPQVIAAVERAGALLSREYYRLRAPLAL